MWPPVGMGDNFPSERGRSLCELGHLGHLGITGTGKVSWSFQC